MTIFNLRSVRLRSGEQYRDRLAVALEPFVLGGQRYEPTPAEIEAEFVTSRVSSGSMFELSFAVVLRGPCYRCLGEAELVARISDRQYQATAPDSEEETTPYLADERLDLSAWARDAIGLAVPEQILCRTECAGLCGGCGANLNLEACSCPPVEADTRWGKLAELRNRLSS